MLAIVYYARCSLLEYTIRTTDEGADVAVAVLVVVNKLKVVGVYHAVPAGDCTKDRMVVVHVSPAFERKAYDG